MQIVKPFQGFLLQTLTIHRTAGEGRGPSYSTLQLPPAHEHSDIYLQLCTWDDYHIFLIATLVFTRLLLDEIYHLIELPFEWLIDDAMFVCLLDQLILGFCYSDLTLETNGFQLASSITLVVQANLLTKCASHPKISTTYKILTSILTERAYTFMKVDEAFPLKQKGCKRDSYDCKINC